MGDKIRSLPTWPQEVSAKKKKKKEVSAEEKEWRSKVWGDNKELS